MLHPGRVPAGFANIFSINISLLRSEDTFLVFTLTGNATISVQNNNAVWW